MTRQPDLTIEEVLADPLIRRVMRADGVEPAQFETLMRTIASRPARRPAASDGGSPTLFALAARGAARGFCGACTL